MEHQKIIQFNLYRSKKLVEDGKYHISNGTLDLAAQAFKESLDLEPTAEGYTYLAWVKNLKGQVDEAIDLCLKATKLDPDFGNPYNDIGSYLIQKGYLDDAIPWLERAKTALHYEPRHFPHINLGRIYSAQGKVDLAIQEFQSALKLVPGHQEILNVLTQLENLKKTQN